MHLMPVWINCCVHVLWYIKTLHDPFFGLCRRSHYIYGAYCILIISQKKSLWHISIHFMFNVHVFHKQLFYLKISLCNNTSEVIFLQYIDVYVWLHEVACLQNALTTLFTFYYWVLWYIICYNIVCSSIIFNQMLQFQQYLQ